MTASRNNPIVAENLKPGTLSWLPERARFTPETWSWAADTPQLAREMASKGANQIFGTGRADASKGETPEPPEEGFHPPGSYSSSDSDRDSGRSAGIEGWCSAPSVKAGDSLQVFVSMNPAGEFMLDVYRMGYYQRMGARQVMSAGPIRGTTQAEPTPDSERLIECAWSPSHEFSIPSDWLSGVYLGKLTRVDDGTESYIIFVVRDERKAEFIVQTSDFTWQAYNGWPTSYSLYSDGGPVSYYGRKLAVSFERPYLSSVPMTGSGEYFVFEYPFSYWLEKMGYDVTYCSTLDTHRGTAAPSRAAGFLSVGHDEYWTVDMYENLRAARDAGVSLGFFSGNIANFAVDPLRPSASGRPNRVFSRVDYFGGQQFLARYGANTETGTTFRELGFPCKAPDEGLLIGAANELPSLGNADWVCSLPDHWVFAGTGMAEGDAIPNLVGHEWQGLLAEGIEGLEVISRGKTHHASVGPAEYIATVYPGPQGNVVFNASTCWWATGLALPPGFQRPSSDGMPSARPDPRVQRITENVLSRMLASRA